jgi:thiamine biosynthesis lipoprotein
MTRHAAPALALAALVLAAACGRGAPYTKETFVMGTKAWVTIAGMNDRDAERAVEAAFREMYRIESVMSTWKSTSELSRLDASAGDAPIRVSRELLSLIDSSLAFSRATDGAFDVTVRPLVLLWGFQGGEATLPSADDVVRTLARVGYARVSIDSAASTVTLPAGMQIDLAGIAKGYAVDRSVAVLRGFGVRDALVNIGGNIAALGAPPGERAWTIGIRDPKGGLGTVGSLLLTDEAVATSGNYENFVEIEGRRYGHIIDPRTGMPVSRELSVTVVAPTALASDALSTGLFVLGPVDGAAAVARLRGVRALYALPAGDGISYKEVGDFGGTLTLAGGAAR